jgi:hypothetical protein
LDALEENVFDIDEKLGSRAIVKAFDAQSLDIGGYLHTALTGVNGEDGGATAFNRSSVELLVKAQIDDRWSSFAGFGFARSSGVKFDDDEDGVLNEAGERRRPAFGITEDDVEIELDQVWVNYRHSDSTEVRFGQMITPVGITNMEHFPTLLLDPERPQFLRKGNAGEFFPFFFTGAKVYGNEFLENGDTVSYHVWAGNDANNDESLAYGARLSYKLEEHGLTVGVNGIRAERSATESSNYSMYGADVLYDKDEILWKTEVYKTSEDSGKDRFAFYTQPAYRFNSQWIGFYRFDVLDDGTIYGNQTEHALGVNYFPNPNLRLRATATNKNFASGGGAAEADAQIYQLSATFAF